MDESGDPGMKLGRGSSAFFTIGLVLFQEASVADACREEIQRLRKKLSMKLSGEASSFHFSKMNTKYRVEFLSAVASFPFQFYSCTIDKQRLSGRAWQKKEYMYLRAGSMAIDLALAHMIEANPVFAATSSKQFDWEFLRALRQVAGYRDAHPVIRETRRLDPYKDDLVQLVDMVCGAITNADPQYLNLIQHRQGGRLIYPK